MYWKNTEKYWIAVFSSNSPLGLILENFILSNVVICTQEVMCYFCYLIKKECLSSCWWSLIKWLLWICYLLCGNVNIIWNLYLFRKLFVTNCSTSRLVWYALNFKWKFVPSFSESIFFVANVGRIFKSPFYLLFETNGFAWR